MRRKSRVSRISDNETPRSKLRGISTKDISNNNAASSGVFTLRENKLKVSIYKFMWLLTILMLPLLVHEINKHLIVEAGVHIPRIFG